MQAEKWESQENIDSDEHDVTSEELDEILEIRMNKARTRLSQNLENGENPEEKGVVGKLFYLLSLKYKAALNKHNNINVSSVASFYQELQVQIFMSL